MSNAIDKLMKMKGKSWTEILARSEQAISVYGERYLQSSGQTNY